MPKTDSQTTDDQKRYPWEFWLVVGMLVALLILILAILLPPMPKPDVSVIPVINGTRDIKFQNLLDYNNMMLASRKDILSIIIAAFGAWVGAGAAYFFGRENLRVAADSLLAMRDLSPKERLRRTSIKQIPPTPIDWTVTRATTIDDVRQSLTDRLERWFIPVVRDDGALDTVINEEALWRYLINGAPLVGATVGDLLTYIEGAPTLKRFKDIHVVVTMETNVGAANDLLDSRHIFLAIVTSEGRPTHFFTTSEVRKLLLQE